jgi:alcohol dehydrogenase (NADP+)
MVKIVGYAAKHSFSSLKPFSIERSEPTENEIQIEILFCGVCHSDVHQVRNEWHNTVYPCMPGHEIVGRVTKVGRKVTKFKLGDIAGVGCMVDSCHHCESCKEGLEQYCDNGFLGTYNGNMRTPSKDNLTFGGYSSAIVVREDFVLKIPANLDPASAAPLMCAGITTYSPMRHWKVGKNTKVGIIGLRGLGHMAVKLAVAMGADVTVITEKKEKAAHAKRLGAKNVIISTDKKEMESNSKTLDFILSTIPQTHDANPYIALLKRDGVLTIVGCIAPLKSALDLSKMIPDRKSLGTSLIGGIAETQEVLDFCSIHNIAPDIKIISIDQINDAFEQLNKGEIDFRYVIDMSSLKGKQEEKGILEMLGIS